MLWRPNTPTHAVFGAFGRQERSARAHCLRPEGSAPRAQPQARSPQERRPASVPADPPAPRPSSPRAPTLPLLPASYPGSGRHQKPGPSDLPSAEAGRKRAEGAKAEAGGAGRLRSARSPREAHLPPTLGRTARPASLPSSCSRLQSPPSSSRARSAPHSPAAAGCLQARLRARASGAERAPSASAPSRRTGVAPPARLSGARVQQPRGGRAQLSPGSRRGGDGSGTTWKTSPGQTAVTLGAGARGCRRAVASLGRPSTSWPLSA